MAGKAGSSMTQLRLVVVLLIGFALIVFVYQNRAPVETRFLMWHATMPRAAALLLTAAVSFIAGLLLPGIVGGRR